MLPSLLVDGIAAAHVVNGGVDVDGDNLVDVWREPLRRRNKRPGFAYTSHRTNNLKPRSEGLEKTRF